MKDILSCQSVVAILLAFGYVSVCNAAGEEHGATGPAISNRAAQTVDEKSMVKERNDTIAALLKTVQTAENNPRDNRAVGVAIKLLGKYRAEESVSTLIDLVSVRFPSHNFWGDNPLDDFFEAAKSLINIGNPAVTGILKKMETPTEVKTTEIHLLAYVIREIDGEEIGIYRLQLEAKAAKGTHKINLLNLTDIYNLKESNDKVAEAILDPRVKKALKELELTAPEWVSGQRVPN